MNHWLSSSLNCICACFYFRFEQPVTNAACIVDYTWYSSSSTDYKGDIISLGPSDISDSLYAVRLTNVLKCSYLFIYLLTYLPTYLFFTY